MGLLNDKVALITGAARGQGRAHAITCAREGADVIAVDLAAQLSTVPYPMGTADELAEPSNWSRSRVAGASLSKPMSANSQHSTGQSQTASLSSGRSTYSSPTPASGPANRSGSSPMTTGSR